MKVWPAIGERFRYPENNRTANFPTMVPPNATKSRRRATPNTPKPALISIKFIPCCTESRNSLRQQKWFATFTDVKRNAPITEETPTGTLQPHCTLYSPTAPTLYSPTTVLLLQPYSTTLYSPTAPTLYSHSTVLLLQPYSTTLYSPTAPTLYSPSTVLLLQPYSNNPTPTTLLQNPLQSHCTNRDSLQQHPYHESPDGRDSYSKTPMRTSHPISPRALLQATPASKEPSEHQPHP
ncbi:hypothetical protein ACOMHN_019408 [Nucella lapillus]